MKRKLLTLLLALAAITCAAIAMLSLSACSEKFEYQEYEDGYNCVYVGPKVTHIDFPSTYKGKPVRGIGIYNSYPSLESITIPNSVTKISEHAFWGCTGLTNITIPNSVTEIGVCAFRDCTSLTNITIPNSVITIDKEAFKDCTGLTSITIPDSVTTIDLWTFSGCTGLSDITIPDSVTSIGTYAFEKCTGLSDITIPDSVTEIGAYAFKDCTGLKSAKILTNTTNANGMFYGCNAIEEVTLPLNGFNISYLFNIYSRTYTVPESLSTVNIIGDTISPYACSNTAYDYQRGTILQSTKIYGCENIKTVNIADTVTTIGDSAFADFTGGNIVFADKSNIKTIGASAFKNCTLTDITLPNSLESIGANAFQNCANLQNVNFDQVKNLESIGAYAFSGCTALTDLTLTSTGCTEIGAQAFYGCTNLKVVYLPEKLESIGSGAFRNCTSLMSASVPRTVTEIGSGAYYGCNALRMISYPLAELEYTSIFPADAVAAVTLTGGTYIPANSFKYSKISSITFPSTITSIGSQAFYGCVGLITVDLPFSLTYIGTNAFYGCKKLITVSNASQLEIAEGETDNGYVAAYAKTITTSAYTNRLINWDGFIFYVGTDSKYYLMGTDVYELTNTVLPDAAYNNGYQVAPTYVIYDYAFYNEDASKFTVISSAVSETGENAFNGEPNYI